MLFQHRLALCLVVAVTCLRASHGELLCRRNSVPERRLGGWSAGRCLRQTGYAGKHCSWRVASRSPAQWEVAATLEGHKDAICAISWSPDQSRILTASADGTAVIWQEFESNYSEIENHVKDAWTSVAILGAHSDSLVRDATWSPDGTRVLTGNLDGSARVWQMSTNVSSDVFEIPLPEDASSVNSNSTKLFHVGQQGPAQEEWEVLSMLRNQPDTILAVDWSSPESATGRVLTGLRDRTACVEESKRTTTRSGLPWTLLVSCATQELRDTRAHGDTHLVSSFARSGSIWHSSSEKPLRWALAATLEASPHLMASARWSPDGQRLLTGGNDGVARIWQLFPEDFHGSGRRYWDVLTSHQAHTEAAWTVAWAPDGQRVLTGGRDGFTHIWRPFNDSGWELEASLTPENGERIEPELRNSALHGPRDYPRLDSVDRDANMGWVSGREPVWVADWSPDGHRVLTGSRDGSARIWLENTSIAGGWSIEATLLGHKHEIWALAWSPDSLEVLTADQAGMARLWRAGDKVAGAMMVSRTSNSSNFSNSSGLNDTES